MMKKNVFFVGMLAILLVFGFLLTGCASTIKNAYGGTSWNLGVPAVKEIKILGLVRVEGLVKNGNGEQLTYDALLRKAEELGGNGIVNVMIDVQRDVQKFFFFTLRDDQTWYGSALAIQYTDTTLESAASTDKGPVLPGALDPDAKGILGVF
jgi:hypothetical protein